MPAELVVRPRGTLLPMVGALVAFCCLSSGLSPAAAADRRPNILFIFADDHAAHAISCYGSRINKTPNLDRLATGGMLFHNCFCTNSVCGPSRAVVLTGKYSHLNGFYRNGDRFDGNQPTFPKMLQKAGYQTAIIGKWHLASDPTGFDVWKILIGLGTYYNPVLIENGKRVPHTGYATDLLADEAIDYLKGRDPQRPFLLMYHQKAPHREFDPNLKDLHLYDEVTIPEPENLFDDYAGRGTAAHVQQMEVVRDLNPRDLKLVPPKELNAEQLKQWNAAYEPKNEAFRNAHLAGAKLAHWKYQRFIKDYLRCVASVDENVGRVLDYLDQTRPGEEHRRDLFVRPGLFSWRPWLVRQAVHVRRVLPHAAARPLAGSRSSRFTVRRPGLKPGLCRDIPRDRRPSRVPRNAGAKPPADPGGAEAVRLADEPVLPLLRVSCRAYGPQARGGP